MRVCSDKEALIATWIERPRLIAFRCCDVVFLGAGRGRAGRRWSSLILHKEIESARGAVPLLMKSRSSETMKLQWRRGISPSPSQARGAHRRFRRCVLVCDATWRTGFTIDPAIKARAFATCKHTVGRPMPDDYAGPINMYKRARSDTLQNVNAPLYTQLQRASENLRRLHYECIDDWKVNNIGSRRCIPPSRRIIRGASARRGGGREEKRGLAAALSLLMPIYPGLAANMDRARYANTITEETHIGRMCAIGRLSPPPACRGHCRRFPFSRRVLRDE